MTVMMNAKVVTKKLTCADCGRTGEFVYEVWPGSHRERVFQTLTIGFKATIPGEYPIITCACGSFIGDDEIGIAA